MATGLINVGILRPELAGSFAAGYRGAEQARQEQQQQQQQTELNQMKLEQLKQDAAALKDLQAKMREAGQSDDPKMFFRALIQTGNPDYMSKGYEGLQRYEELQRNQGVLRQFASELFPGTGAAPAAAPMAPAAPGALGSGTFGITFEPANALAPPRMAAPAATNAMAPAPVAEGAPDVNALRRQLFALSSVNDPRAKAMADVVKAQIAEAAKTPADVATMRALGYPLTQEGFRQYRQAQMNMQQRPPIAVLRDGKPVYVSPEEAVGQVPFTPASVQVLGMGPGREAPAPSITQIQDPTDPARMITIDARRYQGGGVGSPGVIGASGKAAPATTAALKQEQGASQAQDILDNLKFAYEELNRQRAIPSTQRNVLSNTLASIGASGVGQVAGRVAGTEAQTQRDIIASARNQLFAAVKNATGLSAQQLNSNVEFTTWLNSLTDPAKSIEANREILANMERFIASGGKYSARKGGGGQTPAPAAGASGKWEVVR